MKQLAILVLLIFFVAPAHAQITLTESDLRATIGTSIEVRIFHASGPTNEIQALATQSGASQTWDFTNLPFDDGDVETVTTYGSPPAEAPGGDQPPFNAADFVILAEDDDSRAFSYAEFRSDGLYFIGGTNSGGGIESRATNDPPILFLQLPLSYNAQWTTSTTTTTMLGGTTATVEEMRTHDADGYGTLILPNGTFNTLRLKTETVLTSLGVTSTVTLYTWYNQSLQGVAAVVKLDTPSGTTYSATYETGDGSGGGNNPPQSAPTNLLPANNTTDLPTNPTFSWGATADTDSYHLQIATDGNFKQAASPNSALIVNETGISSTSFDVSGLDAGMAYFWRVRGSNTAGDGPWSAVQGFTTMAADPTDVERVGQDIPDRFALETNYPNPFKPQTTIRYAVSASVHVRLAVYDVLGREVAVLVDEGQGAGTYQASFEGNNLPGGVYLYRLTAGSFTASKRMLLLK